MGPRKCKLISPCSHSRVQCGIPAPQNIHLCTHESCCFSLQKISEAVHGSLGASHQSSPAILPMHCGRAALRLLACPLVVFFPFSHWDVIFCGTEMEDVKLLPYICIHRLNQEDNTAVMYVL